MWLICNGIRAAALLEILGNQTKYLKTLFVRGVCIFFKKNMNEVILNADTCDRL